MIYTASAEKLAALLDNFCMPMYAVERLHCHAPFKVLCINSAYQECARLNAEIMRGTVPSDYLPKEQANILTERYQQCAVSQGTLRFQEILTLPAGTIHMDTTLQYLRLPMGGERLICMSIEMLQPTVQRDHTLLEDIELFATWADLQLQNMISLLETYTDSTRRNRLIPEGAHLGGLARCVSQALSDIKRTARQRTQQTQYEPARPPATCAETSTGDATLGALRQAVTHPEMLS